MVVVRAKFYGTKVIIPDSAQGLPAGDVLLIFEERKRPAPEADAWKVASEPALRKAWDNEEDAVYDKM
jgi:hypothetical protein